MRELLRYFQSNMQFLVSMPWPPTAIVPFIAVGMNVFLEMYHNVCPLLVSAGMQFNAKWTYILCVLLFELGSAICGAAPSMDALIIGRAICGVAGSGMYVGVMTLLAITTTIHERPMYISGTGLTWGLGTVLGPVTGSGFSDSPEGWRWAFYINLYPSRSVGCPSPARRPPGGRPVPSAKPKQARNSCLLTHQHHNLASSTTLLPALQSDHEASRRNARIL
jgi:MFS family permease